MDFFGVMRRLIIYLFIPFYSFSQNINRGPRATALARSGVTLCDLWSLQSNPSGAAWIDEIQLGIGSQNLYWGSEIKTNSILAIVPVKGTVLGLTAESHGIREYNNFRAGISFARRFANSFAASLSVNRHQLQIEDMGRYQTFSVDIGFLYKLSNVTTIGVHLANPFIYSDKSLGTYDVPSIYQVGGKLIPSEHLLLVFQLEYSDHTDAVTLGSGLEVEIHNEFKLRGGVSLFPFCHYAGFGYQKSKIQLQTAISSHPILGYSPQVSLSYGF